MLPELAEPLAPAPAELEPTSPGSSSCAGTCNCAAELAALQADVAALRGDMAQLIALAQQLAAGALEAQKVLAGGGMGAVMGALFGRKG